MMRRGLAAVERLLRVGDLGVDQRYLPEVGLVEAAEQSQRLEGP